MRARILLPALLGSVIAATVVPIASAGAEVPPIAEPSLFVVRAPITSNDGVLTVSTKKLEWFTDRPNHDAGSLSTKELVDHWNGWGFKGDPPNAALIGPDTDVIGELSKPKLRGSTVQFAFKPIRGEPGDGKLGKVSLLIDPTGWAGYQLTVVDNSPTPTNIVLYQTIPDTSIPNLLPLAWFSRFADPQTTLTFQWDETYQLMWAQTGALFPGIVFDAAQIRDVNTVPGQNSALLTAPNGNLQFAAGSAPVPAGSIGLTMDGTIPVNTAAYALGQTQQPVFAAPAQPNITALFTPNPHYWLTFGTYQQGEVLDPGQLTNSIEIQFPSGVTAMTATLNSDNTWTVQPS
jgi:rhizosphere induced protein